MLSGYEIGAFMVVLALLRLMLPLALLIGAGAWLDHKQFG